MYIDPVLHHGAATGRTEKETRCYELLDSLNIEYRRADHDPADTIADCQLVEKLLGAKICKNLFLTNRQRSEFYLLLMPGEKPFKTKFLSKQIGSARLSFAGAEDMEQHLNITPGSVSVLGLMNDREGAVHLLMDRELLDEAEFACHPCLNTSTVMFKTEELLNKLLPALGREPQFVELPWETEE